MALLFALILGGIGLQLWSPVFIRDFLDQAQGGQSEQVLIQIALGFIAINLISQVFTLLSGYLSDAIGWDATNRLREDLVSHCLSLDLTFHRSKTSGEMIERIDGDARLLSTLFSRFIIDVLGNGLLVLGILVILMRVDWRVGICVSAFIAGAFWVLTRLHGLGRTHWSSVRQGDTKFFGLVSEALGAAEDLRANQATGYVLNRTYKLFREWLSAFQRAYLAASISTTAPSLFFAAGQAVALFMAAAAHEGLGMSLGTAYLVFSYTSLLTQPVERLREQILGLQQAEVALGRVQELFAQEPSVREHPESVNLPTGALSVQMVGVDFAYQPDQEFALKNIHLEIRADRTLGIVGRTGSGKSTLARLLARLYDPTRGRIHLSGVELSRVRLSDLRQRVVVVSQDVRLFEATVRENMTLFDAEIGDEALLKTLEALGLSSWVQSLPLGLDTPIRPGALSAGEAQLFAFTRAFLKNPGLVILDEISSRLDPATEALLNKAIAGLLRGRTVLIIAHRLHTLDWADDILVMGEGRILEHGSRQALAADSDSLFARLLGTWADGEGDES